MKNKSLKRRIIEISYKYKLSHLGSCITAVDIIDEIYQNKKPEEKFILSSGHAGLALYVIIEKYYGKNAEEIFNHHGVHPDRCSDCFLDCSTGSLGQGLPIALGIALSDRKRSVWCLISDGECSEGSIWEALRIAQEQKVGNLDIYLNFNKWGAYKSIPNYPIHDENFPYLSLYTVNTDTEGFPFLRGQEAHYKVMEEEDYKQAMVVLCDHETGNVTSEGQALYLAVGICHKCGRKVGME